MTQKERSAVLRKHKFYKNKVWPRWIDEAKRSPHHCILLPGIMGSELFDRESNDEIWLDSGIWHEADNLELKTLSPRGAVDVQGQFVYARSTVHPPFVQDPYREILDFLNVGRFPYDWRESLPIEAQRLALFLECLLKEEEIDKVSFVTHSMGGCLLLCLLGQTEQFDDRIDKIIFCAPPFHGALKPLRVIEDGHSGSRLDDLTKAQTIRESGTTLPGLFDLLVAPRKEWIGEVAGTQDTIRLKYPIRGEIYTDLYHPSAWTNKHRPEMRSLILKIAQRYHQQRWSRLEGTVRRLEKKINVIVGLNGKTPYSATRHGEFGWCTSTLPDPGDRMVSNGDGTVLFQSSYLPTLPKDRYWAFVPQERKNTHGTLVDTPEVMQAIHMLLNDEHDLSRTGLRRYEEFIDVIDWSHEAVGAADPTPTAHANYLERERLRRLVPVGDWGAELNPEDDLVRFHLTRDAARSVLTGEEEMETAATRIGERTNFLREHLETMLMPGLFG
jgi:pimeloyl-ACP methyl ester carboxylesterase